MRVMTSLFVAALALSIASTCAAAPSSALVMKSCDVDDEIARSVRAAPERVAVGLMQSVVNGDVAGVYAALSPEARSATGASALEKSVQRVASMGPFTNLSVAHTYLVRIAGGHDPLGPMICGKSLKDPDAVFLAVRAVPEQIYVEVAAHTRNNDWASFVWLEPSGSGWKVLEFSFNATATSGRSARELMDLAMQQRTRGHDLNAVVLASGAETMAQRGQNVNPVWKGELDRQFSTFHAPPELAGPKPLTWALGGQTYRIRSIGLLGVGGALNLQIERLVEAWPSDEAIDSENHRFLKALVLAHPELKDSFAAILVRTIKPDESGGFGTVYEFGKNGA